MPDTIFLLSPANLNGIRARQLTSPRGNFPAAQAYRSPAGVPIGEAFAFMSALYFRGKITYALRFAAPPPSAEGGVFVIAPGFGLVPPDWTIDQSRMKRLRKTKVDPRVAGYKRPLVRDARLLTTTLTDDTRVVLLGSIATGKYVDVLWPIFGDRLLFPRSFVGIGDMSRGSMMLRAAASGEELEYATLDIERHRKRERRP